MLALAWPGLSQLVINQINQQPDDRRICGALILVLWGIKAKGLWPQSLLLLLPTSCCNLHYYPSVFLLLVLWISALVSIYVFYPAAELRVKHKTHWLVSASWLILCPGSLFLICHLWHTGEHTHTHTPQPAILPPGLTLEHADMNITFYNGKLAEYSTPANVSRPPAVYPAPKTEARRTDSDSLLQGDSFSGQQVKCLLACAPRQTNQCWYWLAHSWTMKTQFNWPLSNSNFPNVWQKWKCLIKKKKEKRTCSFWCNILSLQYFDQPVYDLPPALGCCAAPPYPVNSQFNMKSFCYLSSQFQYVSSTFQSLGEID